MLFFAGFGGSLWPRASERVLIDLKEGRDDLLGPTASLKTFGLGLLGSRGGWRLPGGWKFVLVCTDGDDGVMRLLINFEGEIPFSKGVFRIVW